MARTFDPALLSLTFSLPVASIELAVDAYPGSSGALRSLCVSSTAAVCISADTEDARYAHIGLMGGPGSGTSLGSKARNIQPSKYVTSGQKDAPEQAPPPIVMGIGADSAIGLVGAAAGPARDADAFDAAGAARDMAILTQVGDWRSLLAPGLPGLGFGLPPTSSPPSPTWWMTSPYTRAMALGSTGGGRVAAAAAGDLHGEGSARTPLQAVADLLGTSLVAAEAPSEHESAVHALSSAMGKLDAAGGGVGGVSATRRPAQARAVVGNAAASAPGAGALSKVRFWGEGGGGGGGAPSISGQVEALEAELQMPVGGEGSDVSLDGEGGAQSREGQRGGALKVLTVGESRQTDRQSSRAVGAAAIAAEVRAQVEADSRRFTSPLPQREAQGSELGAAPPSSSEAAQEPHPPPPTTSLLLSAADVDALIDAVATASTSAMATGGSVSGALDLVTAKLGAGGPVTRTWAVTKRMTEAELAAAEATFRPAYTWPFPLDAFQRESIAHMEVEGPAAALFVAAHTSAGKTVVAEYACAKAMATRTRAVYTSPIKALSNQKYRDLRDKFGGPDGKGVGLITGDVSVNPDAPVLIMTTEILRSMCYRGDELVRDVSWVIFDEVHYINDAERGLAYEEVLLLLPETAGLIFLSATSPNREEFAEWVGRTKSKRVYVLGTDRRPVPLLHHLFSHGTEGPAGKPKGGSGAPKQGGGGGATPDKPPSSPASGTTLSTGPPGQGPLHLIMDGAAVDSGDVRNGLKVSNFSAAAERLAARQDKKGGAGRFGPVRSVGAGRSGGGRSKGEQQTWRSVLGTLQTHDLLPAIVFSFSKAKCEDCAMYGLGSTDLNNAKERSAVHSFVEGAIKRLAPADRLLPQIIRMRALLLRGIGVHHSGLLPIIKEVVEMLFARGLVKILFATETFAMGVNFPARTVLFNGIRKHDGVAFRDLTPGEYIQMAGRAGRRGLDTRGVVIVMAWGESLPELSTLQSMLLGRPTRLSSSFRLTYNMILNVLRTDIPVTHMMARSYAEFSSQRALGGRHIPRLLAAGAARLTQLQKEADRLPCVMQADGTLDAGVLQAAAATASARPAAAALQGASLDIEECGTVLAKSGVVASAGDVYRNAPGIRTFYEAAGEAQGAHMALLRVLIEHGAGRSTPAVFPLGRVIIVDGVPVPWPGGASATASTASGSPPGYTLTFAPAVVLAAECVDTPQGSSTDPPDMDVHLTVMVLCPAGYVHTRVTPLSGSAASLPPVLAGPPSSASLAADAAPVGMKIVSGKGKEDDDLDGMMGGGKGKKGGKGGGGKAAAVQLPVNSAPTAAHSAGGARDGPVAVGHYATLDTALGSRTVAVLRLSLCHVARVTGLTVGVPPTAPSFPGMVVQGKGGGGGDGVPNFAGGVLAGEGSTAALAGLAGALASLLLTHDADPYSARLRVLRASGVKPGPAEALARVDFSGRLTPSQLYARGYSRQALLLPCIDPSNDMRPPSPSVAAIEAYHDAAVADRRFRSALFNAASEGSVVGTRLTPAAKCAACPLLGHTWDAHARVSRLARQLEDVRARFSVESMALYPEMRIRFHLLRLLRYTKAGAEGDTPQPDGEVGEVSPAGPFASRRGGEPAPPSLDVVSLKGRVAAEVNTCDELLFAEMIFEGITAGLSPAELAAMLSALVFQERSGRAGEESDAAMSIILAAAEGGDTPGGALPHTDAVGEDAEEEAPPVDATPGGDASLVDGDGEDDGAAPSAALGAAPGAGLTIDGGAGEGDIEFAPVEEVGAEQYSGPLVNCIPQHLAQACVRLHHVALALGRVQMDVGLDVVPSAYAKSALNFGLLLPTYAWACGVPFVEICRLTEVAEGSIVRCITRLDETLREVRNAARIIGDPTLFRKAETASAAISRDVIFAASLYHTT